tara:strand:- start:180 stop:818 length:639 start_codon:yes stop_codon:yes gene_type:complete
MIEMKKFYEKYVLPKIINCACGTKPILIQRQKIVPSASGVILEIGVGSGVNIPYYSNSNVKKLIGLDLQQDNWDQAYKIAKKSNISIDLLQGDGEELPIPNNSIDTVLITYTMCTIPNVQRSLAEIKRVLKREGKLLFCEHGLAPDKNVQKWQNKLNPIWKKCLGGCNLNRNIPELVLKSGFSFESISEMYIPSTPKFIGYNYWGTAKILGN